MEQKIFEMIVESMPFMGGFIALGVIVGFVVFVFLKVYYRFDNRLNKVEIRLDNLEVRMEKVETKLDKIDEKLDRKFDTIITLLLSKKAETADS